MTRDGRKTWLPSLSNDPFVEPATPPSYSLHTLALVLQGRGIGRSDWTAWVGRVPASRSLDRAVVARILDGMNERQILWGEAGVLWPGRKRQDAFGRKNFLEPLSVYSAQLFTVLHGRHELGSVDEASLLGRRDDGRLGLLLAGRALRATRLRARGTSCFRSLVCAPRLVVEVREQAGKMTLTESPPLSASICWLSLRSLLQET